MRVLKKGGPLAKTQVGSDEGRVLLMTLLQQGEEQADLGGFGLGVTNLIDQEQVIFDIAADDLVLGPVGLGAVQFIEQIGKEHVAAPGPVVDGLDEEAGGQAGLAATGATGVILLMLRFFRKFTIATTLYAAKKWRSFNDAPPKARTK